MTAAFSKRFQLFWSSTLTVLKQYYTKSSNENIEVPGEFFGLSAVISCMCPQQHIQEMISTLASPLLNSHVTVDSQLAHHLFGS